MTFGPAAMFPAGWYGKLPATGDFVLRRLPGAFRDAWDRWLDDALAGARGRLGSRWPEDYLSMPVWRFVLCGGLAGPAACAGVMAPSVDAVGRFFPLAVASAFTSSAIDPVATLVAAQGWFAAMEAIVLSALSPRADSGAIDADIAGRPFAADWLRRPSNEAAPFAAGEAGGTMFMTLETGLQGAPRAAWMAEACDLGPRTVLVCDTLPAAEPFCAMIDGRWLERGWRPAPAKAIS